MSTWGTVLSIGVFKRTIDPHGHAALPISTGGGWSIKGLKAIANRAQSAIRARFPSTDTPWLVGNAARIQSGVDT